MASSTELPFAEDSRPAADDGVLPSLEVAGHQATLFTAATPMIAAMVADIRSAQRRVWLESYIFANDNAGQAIIQAMADRARAGLDVRLMYDAVGSVTSPRALFRPLREAGAQVHAFHSFGEALARFSPFSLFNQRNHRKLLTIDDRVGYFGGMNIVDQTQIHAPADEKRLDLPVSSGWRDVHVRLEGPLQSQIAEAQASLWRYAHRRFMTRGRRWPIRELFTGTEDGIFFFDCRPMFHYRRASRVLAPLIRRAKRSITISMAYFIPIGRVLRELLRARRRGVRIRVIVPEESDVKSVQRAARHLFAALLRRGIRLYERRDQMLHSKVMVIDETYSVVGSCNLDPRSLRVNLEFVGVFRSAEMARTLLGVAQHEIENSRRVTVDCCRNRNCWNRTLDRVAWSFRRLL